MTSFRAHSLDGAMLFFDRVNGLNVRVENARTASLRRQAPRVVMFGITNACNLRCEFCSRDLARDNAWTVDSAAEMLEGLARAGTLEVAFGGGEPFAFRGFGALLERLRRTTELALHVTTNGTLLDGAEAGALEHLDQVRLSIYEGWRPAARKLAGRRWGANVLVDDAALPGLPALLLELAALGAVDVSLLSYVGADSTHHLSATGTRALEAVIAASPIPCRVSVCFGDRLSGLARTFGGDCGAGLDFVTLTSDQRMQACSFQNESHPVASADDVLALWRKRVLDAPSPRAGCARSAKQTGLSSDGIRIWHGFSGNNSGECVLVAKFDAVEDAETMLAELAPGLIAGARYSQEWRDIFEREKVETPGIGQSFAPDEMAVIGRTFIARTDSALDDEFPELRALAWKRGANVRPGGIHVHDSHTALWVARAGKDAKALAAETGAVVHGEHVIGALLPHTLAEAKEWLSPFVDLRAIAFELFEGQVLTEDLHHALPRVHSYAKLATVPRFTAWFSPRLDEDVVQFAEDNGGTAASNLVVVENVVRRKRLAVHALRKGASVSAIDGAEVVVSAYFYVNQKKQPPFDPEPLKAQLIGVATDVVVKERSVSFHTKEPLLALVVCAEHAKAIDFAVSLGLRETDPLVKALARLLADV